MFQEGAAAVSVLLIAKWQCYLETKTKLEVKTPLHLALEYILPEFSTGDIGLARPFWGFKLQSSSIKGDIRNAETFYTFENASSIGHVLITSGFPTWG